MEIVDRIVDFETHCKTCKHEDLNENEEPCNECLDNPTNECTTKPVNWVEKEKKR